MIDLPRHSCRPRPATFSIVARDPETGELGVAVASKFLAVGNLVPTALAGVGAIANQANLDPANARLAMELIKAGASAQEAVDILIARQPERPGMQFGIVDAQGGSAAFTAPECIDWAGHQIGPGYACQGNVLAGQAVAEAIAHGFEASGGDLCSRLVAALQAGDRAGGDRRGKQSASVLTVRKGGGYAGTSDSVVDLRVDDHPEPVSELARLTALHALYFKSTPPEEKLALSAPLLLDIQARLRHAGYLIGGEEGVLCAQTRAAIEHWAAMENFEERVDVSQATIDPPVVDFLQRQLPLPRTR